MGQGLLDHLAGIDAGGVNGAAEQLFKTNRVMLTVEADGTEDFVLVALQQYLQILECQRWLCDLAAPGQPPAGKGFGNAQELRFGDKRRDAIGAGGLAGSQFAMIHDLTPQAAMTMAMRRSISS